MTHVPDASHFEIHDVSRFPIVRARAEVARPGYGPDWIREMERLLSASAPFVLLYCDPQPEEDHEDFKLRGIWMKINKVRLAAQCKAVVRVEPDAGERAKLQHHSIGAQKAFGVRTEVAATVEEAFARAATLCTEATSCPTGEG